jgi:hypothetical protein
LKLTGQWTYCERGRKAIHEAGHIAAAFKLGFDTGNVTVNWDDSGGGYTEVCDDWIERREPKRIEPRLIVAMSGIASDVAYGRGHCVPDNRSWDQMYASNEGWRSDICKTSCLHWLLQNPERLRDLSVSCRNSDHLIEAIATLPGYQVPARSCVHTYFGRAKKLVEAPGMGDLIGQLSEELWSRGTLPRTDCVRIWKEYLEDNAPGGVDDTWES